MRTFEKFPESKKCPICKTNESKEAVLISIVGTNTEESKLTYEADVFHLDCIDLWYDKTNKIIYQKVEDEREAS